MPLHTGEDSDKMTPLSDLGTTYDFLETRHTSKEITTGLNQLGFNFSYLKHEGL